MRCTTCENGIAACRSFKVSEVVGVGWQRPWEVLAEQGVVAVAHIQRALATGSPLLCRARHQQSVDSPRRSIFQMAKPDRNCRLERGERVPDVVAHASPVRHASTSLIGDGQDRPQPHPQHAGLAVLFGHGLLAAAVLAAFFLSLITGSRPRGP